MQRHCKRNKAKVIGALLSAVIVVTLFVVNTFAIVPPDSYGQTVISFGSRISESAAADLVEMVRQMDELKYFVGSRAFMLGYYSETTVSLQLYTTTENVSILIGEDGSYTINGFAETYRLTEYGWKLTQVNAEGATIPYSGVVAYRLNATSNIIVNSSFEYGTWEITDTLAQTISDWNTFYNNVINYEQNIEDAYDEGYDDAYQQGYEDGYYAGQSNGSEGMYDAGYDDGYADAEDYYTPLLAQRYAEGYTAGYDKGFVDGGNGEGGSVTIVEDLDIGSIISALPAGAKSIINGAFGFEIFGINVAGTLTAILVVAIVAFVAKRLISFRS